MVGHAYRLLRPGGRFVLHVHNRWFNLRDRAGRRWLVADLLGMRAPGCEKGDRVMPVHQGIAGLTLRLSGSPDTWGLMCEGDLEEVYRQRSLSFSLASQLLAGLALLGGLQWWLTQQMPEHAAPLTFAAASGLQVAQNGQIIVDRTMRSVSHPNVYAAGDSAYAIGDNGRPLPMSCASAGDTSRQATDAIVGRLTGRKIPHTKLGYPGNHISLGRRDGILQPVDNQAQPKPTYVGGRKAAGIKVGILKISLWATAHPTFGLPTRKRHLAAAPDPSHQEGDRVAA